MTMSPPVVRDAIPNFFLELVTDANVGLYSYTPDLNMRWFLV